MTNDEIMAELKADTPLNRARAKFSGWAARIEQEGIQRNPIGPIEVRGLEFQAVREIVAAYALAAAPSLPEGKAEPVAYRFVPKEQTTVEDHIWRFAAMHPGDQWRVEPLFVAPVQP